MSIKCDGPKTTIAWTIAFDVYAVCGNQEEPILDGCFADKELSPEVAALIEKELHHLIAAGTYQR